MLVVCGADVILKMLKQDGEFVHLIGEDVCTSKTIEKTLSPQWEERLELVGPAAEMEGAQLLVEVHDADGFLDMDDKLGSAEVDISSASAGGSPVEFSEPLDPQGTVHFALTKIITRVTIEEDGVQRVTEVTE